MSRIAEEAAAVPAGNPYQPQMARIVRIYKTVPENHLFTLRFLDPELAAGFRHQPGQFVMVSVPGAGEMPISIASSPSRSGVLELCVRRVGRVTNALYRLKTNDLVGLRGPYGNGFPIADMRGMLFGEELASLADRADMSCLLTVDADPAGSWKHYIGLLPSLFDRAAIDPPRTYAAVCGPPVVYQFILRRLLELGFSKDRILMSLERRMKCGIGKCGYCLVGHKYSCPDGPIFTYWDAINLPEMI